MALAWARLIVGERERPNNSKQTSGGTRIVRAALKAAAGLAILLVGGSWFVGGGS
jgi:hypothetical protein